MSLKDEINSAFSAPWEGAGEARLAHAQESGARFMNMAAAPLGGQTGKTVHKTVGEHLEAAGRSHVVGSGLATGRVSKRLAAQAAGGPVVVRPSMRAQMLAESGHDTYREHDLTPGAASVWHPETTEDMEVRQAGLPPLRGSSRAGFMPGLGSVAMHRQEARAHEAIAAPHIEELSGLQGEHGRAQRRQKAALDRGDTAVAKVHGATIKELAGQIKEKQAVIAPIQKMADHHYKVAGEIAATKIHGLQMIKDASDMDTGGKPFVAAALDTHKGYFDPDIKEEFYPHASQAQLHMVAAGGGVNSTQAGNVTAMGSAQRRWRNKDVDSGIVTHPNLILAETFAAHHQHLVESGELQRVGEQARKTAVGDILDKRTALSQHKHELDLAAGRPTNGPKPIKTEVTQAHIDQHVSDRLASHVADTYDTPAPLMGLAKTHGRDMARLLNAQSPAEMADVWGRTDSDKRPTFALALAASHMSRSVRRQSAQAMTVDTHRVKELGIDYNEVLGTGSGMHSTSKAEIPHQPGRSTQPAYNALAMIGSRAALRMTADRFKEGGQQESITPRYAQENPWGLFAAENQADVAKAMANKAAGGAGQVRASAGGYYTEQAHEAVSRTEEFHKANPHVRRDKYKNIDEDMW